MQTLLRRHDPLIRYSTAVAAVAVATILAHMLPHHRENPVFLFIFISVVVLAWIFGWRAGAVAAAVGIVGMISLSLKADRIWLGLMPGMAIRIISNSLISALAIWAVHRIRVLERRNSIMLRHHRLLMRRQQKSVAELEKQVLLTERSNERLAFALQAGGAGIFEFESKRDVIRWSAELASIHGLPSAARELNYTDWLDTVHPEDRDLAEKAVQDSLRSGELKGEWRTLRRDNGEIRWLATRGKVTFGANGEPIRMIGVATDITEQKAAEELLIRTEKLASVGRMAATVAHEINNPLECIVNAVYIATLDPNLAAQTVKTLRTAELELQRIAHLTRQTLGFYHESAAPTWIDISHLIHEVVSLFGPKIRQKRIVVDLERCSPCRVHGVAGEVRHVISNLLLNAIEASEPGTRVQIRSRIIRRLGKPLARLTVADEGCGIERKDRDRIFEPFFTTQLVGTGLGLWVTSEIVERHKGTIRVKSAPGRGSVFCVFLPTDSDSPISSDSGVGLKHLGSS